MTIFSPRCRLWYLLCQNYNVRSCFEDLCVDIPVEVHNIRHHDAVQPSLHRPSRCASFYPNSYTSTLTSPQAHTLYYASAYTDLSSHDPPLAISSNTHPPTVRSAAQPRSTRGPTPTSALTLLLADEAMLFARKNAIRRLGATWLRPPGVTKTMQALADEHAERAEAEELARREAAAQEMRAAQEAAEARARGDAAEVERDLDDAVPDAGDVDYDSGEEETGVDDEMEREDDGATVDESGMMSEDADADADMGEDLDAEVPYAESYEHTDTEVEDESASELNFGGERFAAAQDEQSEVTNTSSLLHSSIHPNLAAAFTPPSVSQHPAHRAHAADFLSLHSGGLGRHTLHTAEPPYSRLSIGASTRISGTVGTPGPPRALFDMRPRLTPTLTPTEGSGAQWQSGERDGQASASSVEALGWRGFGASVSGGIGAGMDGEADEDEGSEMVFSSPAAARRGGRGYERRMG